MMGSKPAPPSAFDVGQLTPILRRYFRRRVAAVEVDDLVQEVFVQLQSRRRDEAIENMDRYVFVVAANVLSRRHRRERRWTAGFEPDETKDAFMYSPEHALLSKEELAAAVSTLAKMPTRTRNIFLLHRFENIPHLKIAAAMGISRSAVEKHLIRAYKALNRLGEE